MAFEMQCQCGQRFTVDENRAGQSFSCHNCASVLTVPFSTPVPPASNALPPQTRSNPAAVPQAGPQKPQPPNATIHDKPGAVQLEQIPKKPPLSAAAICLAVINFVLAALSLMCGGIGMIFGMQVMSLTEGYFAGEMTFILAGHFGHGVLLVVGGVGLLMRGAWGSIVTFVAGLLSAFFAVYYFWLYLDVSAITEAIGSTNLEQVSLAPIVVLILIFGGYTLSCLGLLLIPTFVRSKQRAAAGPHQQRSPLKAYAFAGVAAVLIAVCLVAWYWLSGAGYSGGIEMSYLPQDTKVIHHMRVADAFASDGMQDVLAKDRGLQSLIDRMEESTGLKPNDVESVTLAYRDKDANEVVQNNWTMGKNIPYLGVARLNSACDKNRLLSWIGDPKPETHNGESYFPFSTNQALFLPNDKTIIFGTRDEVKLAIDSKGESPNTDAFDIINPDDHMTVALDLSATDAYARMGSMMKKYAQAKSHGYASRFSEGDGLHTERLHVDSSRRASQYSRRTPVKGDDVDTWTEGPVFVFTHNQWRASAASVASRSLLQRVSYAKVSAVHQALMGLKSDDPQKQQYAATMLFSLEVDEHRRDEVAKLLEDSLSSKTQNLAASSARALEKWGRQESTPALVQQLKSDNYQLRRACINTLASVGDESAIRPIAALLNGRESASATAALKKMGSKAESEVATYLTHENANVRMKACDVLGVIGTKNSFEGLGSLESDPMMRALAERAVTAILGRLPMDDKIAALNRNNVVLRRGAMRRIKTTAVDESKRAQVAKALQSALETDDRGIAAEALVSWAGPENAPALMKHLGNPETKLRVACVNALIRVGDQEQITTLLESDDALVRRSAQLVLSAIETRGSTSTTGGPSKTGSSVPTRPTASTSAVDLTFLPADTQMVHYIRLSDAIDKKFANTIFDHRDNLEKRSGIKAQNVESIVIGYPARSAPNILSSTDKHFFSVSGCSFLAVVRTTTAIDQARLVSWIGAPRPRLHDDTPYYSFDSRYGFFFPNESTLVVGTLDALKIAIRDKAKPSKVSTFGAIDPIDHIALAVDLGSIDEERISSSQREWKALGESDVKVRVLSVNYSPDRRAFDRVEFSSQQAAKDYPNSSSRPRSSSEEVSVEGNLAVIASPGHRSTAVFTTQDLANKMIRLEGNELHELIIDLKGSSSSRKEYAARELARKSVVPHRRREIAASLTRLLSDNSSATVLQAVEALAQWGGPENLPSIILLLDSQHSQIQAAAVDTLQQIADPVVIPDLASRLGQRNFTSGVFSAVKAFGYLAEPDLILLLKSRNRDACRTAINLLGSVGGEKSLPALKPLLNDGNMRLSAEKAIQEITERDGKPVLPRYLPTSTIDQIVAALNSDRSSDNERALDRVMEINVNEKRRQEVVDALEALYTSSFRGVPSDAIAVVGKWGTSDNVPNLLKHLQDTEGFPRSATYHVLAEFGDARAIAPLVTRLETNDYRTLKQVIPRFGSAAEPELLKLFESTSNSQARDSALFLLGEVGGETSLRILEPLAKESGAEGYRAKLAVDKILARSE